MATNCPLHFAGAVVMGPLVLLPSVHLGLSGGFIFTGEVSVCAPYTSDALSS